MELIKIENNLPLLDAETARIIAQFERAIKNIKEQEDALKTAILDEMERKGIVKIETEEMTISYVASYDKENFKSKEFKKDHADLYDEYVKMSPVKASVRIKLNE